MVKLPDTPIRWIVGDDETTKTVEAWSPTRPAETSLFIVTAVGDRCYTVTHQQAGMATPGHYTSRVGALNVARRLNELLADDAHWTSATPMNPVNTSEWRKAHTLLADMLLDICTEPSSYVGPMNWRKDGN